MDFSFGIITDGSSDSNINLIIDSIESLSIPNYEIIIIGNSKIRRDKVSVVTFDESIVPIWITKKKNLITQNAQYENIVYLHDYIVFDQNWYEGFLRYGNDFKVCMTKIFNFDGSRFRDWIINPWDNDFIYEIVCREGGPLQCMLPYNMNHLSKRMYISGSYWVAKKNIMIDFPLNENLSWGQGEDVEWSKRVRAHFNFSMNSFSSVTLLKQKDPVFVEPSQKTINILRNIV